MAETKAKALTEAKTPKYQLKYQLVIDKSADKNACCSEDYYANLDIIDLPISDAPDVNLYTGRFIKGAVINNENIGYRVVYYTWRDLDDIKERIALVIDASIVNEKQKQGVMSLIELAFSEKERRKSREFDTILDNIKLNKKQK